MKITLAIKSGQSESRHVVEMEPFRTVLDAVERIRSGGKSDLVYRHSCHHGSCGTCGAMINGKPRLMCLAKIGEFETDLILIEPLRKMTVLAGIAVHPGKLFETLPATGYLKSASDGGAARSSQQAGLLYRGLPDPESTAMRLEDCIECGLCVAACPVTVPFLGPAALAAAEIEMKKYPSRASAMKAFVTRPDGAAVCERAFECSRACPQNVAPGKKITEILRLPK